MTYDFHGQFDAPTSTAGPDNITGFLSAMQTVHQYQTPAINQYNVTDAVKNYIAQGVPAAKLVVGIPAYTRIEESATTVTDTNMGLYLPLAAMTDQPVGEAGGGMTDYKCIINNAYCWGGYSFDRSTLNFVPSNIYLAAKTITPWAYDKSQNWFLSYDNGQSANYKAKWAAQNGLAGMMVWELDADIPNTDTYYQQNSIIYNAWLGLMN